MSLNLLWLKLWKEIFYFYLLGSPDKLAYTERKDTDKTFLIVFSLSLLFVCSVNQNR